MDALRAIRDRYVKFIISGKVLKLRAATEAMAPADIQAALDGFIGRFSDSVYRMDVAHLRADMEPLPMYERFTHAMPNVVLYRGENMCPPDLRCTLVRQSPAEFKGAVTAILHLSFKYDVDDRQRRYLRIPLGVDWMHLHAFMDMLLDRCNEEDDDDVLKKYIDNVVAVFDDDFFRHLRINVNALLLVFADIITKFSSDESHVLSFLRVRVDDPKDVNPYYRVFTRSRFDNNVLRHSEVVLAGLQPGLVHNNYALMFGPFNRVFDHMVSVDTIWYEMTTCMKKQRGVLTRDHVLIAYGLSGTGKTSTFIQHVNPKTRTVVEQGLIQKMLDGLTGAKINGVYETDVSGNYVRNTDVHDVIGLYAFMELRNDRGRNTHATIYNLNSSRSHVIIDVLFGNRHIFVCDFAGIEPPFTESDDFTVPAVYDILYETVKSNPTEHLTNMDQVRRWKLAIQRYAAAHVDALLDLANPDWIDMVRTVVDREVGQVVQDKYEFVVRKYGNVKGAGIPCPLIDSAATRMTLDEYLNVIRGISSTNYPAMSRLTQVLNSLDEYRMIAVTDMIRAKGVVEMDHVNRCELKFEYVVGEDVGEISEESLYLDNEAFVVERNRMNVFDEPLSIYEFVDKLRSLNAWWKLAVEAAVSAQRRSSTSFVEVVRQYKRARMEEGARIRESLKTLEVTLSRALPVGQVPAFSEFCTEHVCVERGSSAQSGDLGDCFKEPAGMADVEDAFAKQVDALRSDKTDPVRYCMFGIINVSGNVKHGTTEYVNAFPRKIKHENTTDTDALNSPTLLGTLDYMQRFITNMRTDVTCTFAWAYPNYVVSPSLRTSLLGDWVNMVQPLRTLRVAIPGAKEQKEPEDYLTLSTLFQAKPVYVPPTPPPQPARRRPAIATTTQKQDTRMRWRGGGGGGGGELEPMARWVASVVIAAGIATLVSRRRSRDAQPRRVAAFATSYVLVFVAVATLSDSPIRCVGAHVALFTVGVLLSVAALPTPTATPLRPEWTDAGLSAWAAISAMVWFCW